MRSESGVALRSGSSATCGIVVQTELRKLRRLREPFFDDRPVGEEFRQRHRLLFAAQRLIKTVVEIFEQLGRVRFDFVALGDDDPRPFGACEMVEHG